jgi:hypothetical protein
MPTAGQPSASRSRKALFVAGALGLSLVLAFIGGELMTRFLWKEPVPVRTDERTLSYRFDSELGWFPIQNSTCQFQDERLITIKNNADGFRDATHGLKSKKRIAFLGDSFVWGYDVEQSERFTEKLQRLKPDWEILNLGVSGYGTDQEYLVLQKWFGRYQPDILVLVFSDNDVEENTLNIVHGGYYKPYFEEIERRLVERGVPVPKSIRYYCSEYPLLFKSRLLRMILSKYLASAFPKHVSSNNPTFKLVQQIRDYVNSKGAKFVLGFVTDIEGAKKRSFCEAAKIDYLFLLDGPHLTWDYMYRSGGHHWTPLGHDLVCSRLHDFLETNHFVSGDNTHPPNPK